MYTNESLRPCFYSVVRSSSGVGAMTFATLTDKELAVWGASRPRTYWAIRQKSTGWFMPTRDGVRGRGYTHDEPSEHRAPRLFTSARGAKQALVWWLKGETTAYRHVDSWTGEADEDVHTIPVPGRNAKDMEVVEVEIGVRQ